MTAELLATILALVAAAAPAALLAVLGVASLLARPLPEGATGLLVRLTFTTAIAADLALVAVMAAAGIDRLVIPLGVFMEVDEYAFHAGLLVDRLSVPFALLNAVLCGVVGSFAHRYLHREPGYNRFFVLLALFATGMGLTVLGASVETIFTGWELVGLASALLIAFYHDRPMPVRNGLRTLAIYRLTDVGLLGAAVLLHHLVGTGELLHVLGTAPWPDATTPVPPGPATAAALLLLVAAMGKSAQVPLSGWLPRAMEGPTPSSAIFYGALSVHAGAYLLLRAAPLLERSPVAAAAVVVVGVATALHATLVGRVQTDVKAALAYASLTQVGVIIAEIGLGLRLVPVAHAVGHACVRTLQLLRAPSALDDWSRTVDAVGGVVPRTGGHLERLVPAALQRRLYRHCLERGRLDAGLERWLVGPVLRAVRFLDALERRWTARLAGSPAGESGERPVKVADPRPRGPEKGGTGGPHG